MITKTEFYFQSFVIKTLSTLHFRTKILHLRFSENVKKEERYWKADEATNKVFSFNKRKPNKDDKNVDSFFPKILTL
jgi:hypothetical protein